MGEKVKSLKNITKNKKYFFLQRLFAGLLIARILDFGIISSLRISKKYAPNVEQPKYLRK
jgi:hypothetical protein